MKRQLEIQLSAELTINATVTELDFEDYGVSFYAEMDEGLIEEIMDGDHEWLPGIAEFYDGTIIMTMEHPQYEEVLGGFTRYWLNRAEEDPEDAVEQVLNRLDDSHCTPSMRWEAIAAIAQAQIK